MQYVDFVSDYFQQEEMRLRLTHIVVCTSSLFLVVAEKYSTVSLHNNLFIHSPVEVVSSSCQYWVKLIQTFMFTFLCEQMFLFLLAKYLGVGLLVYMVSICLVVWETDKLFSRVSVPFPTSSVWEFQLHLILVSTWFCHLKKILAIFRISLKIGSINTFYSVESYSYPSKAKSLSE